MADNILVVVNKRGRAGSWTSLALKGQDKIISFCIAFFIFQFNFGTHLEHFSLGNSINCIVFLFGHGVILQQMRDLTFFRHENFMANGAFEGVPDSPAKKWWLIPRHRVGEPPRFISLKSSLVFLLIRAGEEIYVLHHSNEI